MTTASTLMKYRHERAITALLHYGGSGDLSSRLTALRGRIRDAALAQQAAQAECLKHACTRVVGGGASKAEDDVSRTQIQRVTDQLTYAKTTGAQGITLSHRHMLQTGCTGHFDDCDLAWEPTPLGLDRAT